MGVLASNRKRAEEFTTHNYYSHSPDFRFSKRPRFSVSSTDETSDRKPAVSSKSTASRLARYPAVTAPLRREVHAPCRNQKFGFWKPKSLGTEVMGNTLNSRYEKAKSVAMGALRFLGKGEEKEVIDVEREVERGQEKEGFVSGDSSVEEIVNLVEDGREGQSEGNGVVEDVQEIDCKVVAASSISDVTEDRMRVDVTGKMIESLSLAVTRDVSDVSAYKKLYEEVSRRNDRLNDLGFEIELNEKKRSFYESFRTEKQLQKEEIPREPFVDLTEEDENLVKLAFSANRRKVLVTHESSNIEITGEIMRCLHPGAWLNDEVINLYLELLKDREKREPKKYLKCHFFNTFFYKKLISGKGCYDYKSVRRWTSQRKLGYMLKDCEKIFVPIHKEVHWCLAIINKKDEKFQYLDSLGGRDTRVLKVLAKYFVDEVKDKSGEVIDVGSWEQEFVKDLPEQENGFDCGMFMIKYSDFYSRGLDLCFDQRHMPYFRRRTAKEILKLRAE